MSEFDKALGNIDVKYSAKIRLIQKTTVSDDEVLALFLKAKADKDEAIKQAVDKYVIGANVEVPPGPRAAGKSYATIHNRIKEAQRKKLWGNHEAGDVS
jgi:hypothetical protein